MGSRRRARVLAMQALFGWEMQKADGRIHDPEDLYSFPWLDEEHRLRYDDDVLDFGRYLVAGTLEHTREIDDEINRHLEHWDIQRLAKVDLAILRISVYGLLYQLDIPPSIIINEAVEIAKEYSGADSFRFVNGVLDGVRKNRRIRGENRI